MFSCTWWISEGPARNSVYIYIYIYIKRVRVFVCFKRVLLFVSPFASLPIYLSLVLLVQLCVDLYYAEVRIPHFYNDLPQFQRPRYSSLVLIKQMYSCSCSIVSSLFPAMDKANSVTFAWLSVTDRKVHYGHCSMLALWKRPYHKSNPSCCLQSVVEFDLEIRDVNNKPTDT